MTLRMFDDPEEEALYHLLQPLATTMNEWGAQHDPQHFAVRRAHHHRLITVHRRRQNELFDADLERGYQALVPADIEVRFEFTPLTRIQKIAVQKVLRAAFQRFCALDVHLLWWGVMEPSDPFEIHVDETGRIPDLSEVRRVSGLSEELIADDLIRIKPSRRVSLVGMIPTAD
ncbi:hypothetical protein FDO65_12520 [Nakamurella flava]|uniref:Uncharacterized protein n=1 Tax=Nakamurella flava TaxID=2576308 RepID=A0A4U6QE82_9ACTN|nr:hypothetical protein [Nakamurella flava]TKV58390.1 hypothetical protein FDO65_12520 [Nakamurella flava]